MGQTTLKLFESNFMPTVVFIEYISLIVSTPKMNCHQNSSFFCRSLKQAAKQKLHQETRDSTFYIISNR